MRTRFLNTNYFNPSPIKALESLTFLHLPVPHIASKPPSAIDDFLHFDEVIEASLQIENLHIDSALSKFLSDVLPQKIDADIGDLGANVLSPSSEDHVNRWSRCFSSGSAETQCSEKGIDIAVGDTSTLRCEVIQFEEPLLDLFLENAFFFKNEEMKNLAEVPNFGINMDMLSQGLTILYTNEIQTSVYSVERITSGFSVNQKIKSVEDDSFEDQMQFHQITFPSLEVEETSLGTLTCLFMNDILSELLENIESRQWMENYKLLSSNTEILDSMQYETGEFLSDHCLRMVCLDSVPVTDIFQGLELNSIIEDFKAQDNSDVVVSKFIFEELQILDVDFSQRFEEFFDIQTSTEPETIDLLFSKSMKFKNFDELVVSHELALEDDTFKSLPVPILSDQGNISLLYPVIEEILADIKAQSLFASDGIYLDWHLLEEDKCGSRMYTSYRSILEEIDSCCKDFDQESYGNENLVYDYLFNEDAFHGLNTEESGESKEFLYSSTYVLFDKITGVSSRKLLNDGCSEKRELAAVENEERDLLQSKCTSQFNDLEFFLKTQKTTSDVKISQCVVNPVETVDVFHKDSYRDPMAANVPLFAAVDSRKRNIMFHQVRLSDNILALINNLEKGYQAILQNETGLIKTYLPFAAEDHFKILSLSKQQLMDCIRKLCPQATNFCEEIKIVPFVTLCAIKQAAWYICFYGIHPAHLYLDKLCKSLEFLKSKLCSIRSLIEDAYSKAYKEITISHPALSVIREILCSKTDQHIFKVLIVAEKIFWWSLKNLLMSMGLSFKELHYVSDAKQQVSNMEFKTFKDDDLLVSDCLLVSRESISASFPFNKFSIILEYGHSDGSQISFLSPKLVDLPQLHFLTLKLDDSVISKALFDGVDMPPNNEMTMEGESSSLLHDGSINSLKLEKLLNFLPIAERCNLTSSKASDEVGDFRIQLPFLSGSCTEKFLPIDQSRVSLADTVIVVNTQNLDKEMIVSRRSSYQRILALEKEGAQVVERDSNLPVDLIISSATCLVWYNCRNIGRKPNNDEYSSCLPMCIENVATEVLTSTSFAFSVCVLVFEGDISFLSAVMEYSDGLYAAAASLGIELQLFCSYSSEFTDEILLSCIKYAGKGLYTKMPESETLAESFLTKFPSINPLTAHAILSSGGLLNEFLEWSQKGKLQAIQKYHVPDESLSLFSALCKFGEREDSKSIMTDCSSSVSSGPSSDQLNVGSQRKRQKYLGSPHNIDDKMGCLHFDPFRTSAVSRPCDTQMLKNLEIFDEFKELSPPLDDLLGQKRGLESFDADLKMNSFKVSKPCDTWISNCLDMSDETKKFYFPSNDKLFDENQKLVTSRKKELGSYNMTNSDNQHEDLVGEVIHLINSPELKSDFSSVANSKNHLPLISDLEFDSLRQSKTAGRLAFGKDGHPTLSKSSKTYLDSNILNHVKENKQSSQGLPSHYRDLNFKNNKLPLGYSERFLEEDLVQGYASKGLSPRENSISHSGQASLSNALRSDHLQENSPWTMEFLNRIREKSRMRQQSLPRFSPHPSPSYVGNISKSVKRRSPSILEFFRYQGGSSMRKIPEKKRQKQSATSSRNEINSASVLPTWTPIDKRSRKALSFAMNGSGNQTKLVWSD